MTCGYAAHTTIRCIFHIFILLFHHYHCLSLLVHLSFLLLLIIHLLFNPVQLMGFSCCIFHLTYWVFFFLKFHFFQCFHVRSNLFCAHIIVLISCSCGFVSSLNLFHLTSVLFISFNTIRVILLNGFHIMYSMESLL